jgi:hypothetical protein
MMPQTTRFPRGPAARSTIWVRWGSRAGPEWHFTVRSKDLRRRPPCAAPRRARRMSKGDGFRGPRVHLTRASAERAHRERIGRCAVQVECRGRHVGDRQLSRSWGKCEPRFENSRTVLRGPGCQNLGARLASRFHQVRERFGPAFDRPWLDPIRTVADALTGEVLEGGLDQDAHLCVVE